MSSELAKSNAPTMFNISGFDQFAKYQKYCEPLQDTEAYKLLTDDGKAYSYTIDGDSFTLPYAAEWYGIIYNKKIINDYASKDYAVIKSADDIKDYKTLKAATAIACATSGARSRPRCRNSPADSWAVPTCIRSMAADRSHP